MKYTINELANSKGVSQPVREALLHMEAELEATNRQVEILSDALAESRREVAALKAVQEPLRGWWAHTNPETGLVDVVSYQLTQADKAHGWIEQEIYTTPPAANRPWVGLTQEEFRDFASTLDYGTGGLIRAIEAKLKEKNT